MNHNIPKHHPQLGQHLGSYRKPLMKDLRFTAGITFAAPALLILSLILLMLILSKDTTIEPSKLMLYSVVLGSPILIGGLLIGLAVNDHRQRQELYKGGLLLTQGNRFKIIPFEQIVAVWQKQIDLSFESKNSSVDFAVTLLDLFISQGRTFQNREGRRVYQYRIETKDQGMLISEIPEIGNYTLEILMQRELPRLRAIYKQGNDLQFGSLTLNQRGIKKGKKELPWHKLKLIRINPDRELVIDSQKRWIFIPWLSIKAEKLPNFPILWQFLTELQSELRFQLQGNLETTHSNSLPIRGRPLNPKG